MFCLILSSWLAVIQFLLNIDNLQMTWVVLKRFFSFVYCEVLSRITVRFSVLNVSFILGGFLTLRTTLIVLCMLLHPYRLTITAICNPVCYLISSIFAFIWNGKQVHDISFILFTSLCVFYHPYCQFNELRLFSSLSKMILYLINIIFLSIW